MDEPRESFPQLTTIRRGFGGSHLPDSTAFADRIIIPHKPAKIVLYAGENDIARGDSPEETFDAYKKFITKIHTALPHTPIYYIAIKPAPIVGISHPRNAKPTTSSAATAPSQKPQIYQHLARHLKQRRPTRP
jgi:lysophospholipase L1-like esterase